MNKEIPFSGFCPLRGKECQIVVTYVSNAPLSEPRFEKGTWECALRSTDCDAGCPIAKDVPDIIH